jgi:hypothetical protein
MYERVETLTVPDSDNKKNKPAASRASSHYDLNSVEDWLLALFLVPLLHWNSPKLKGRAKETWFVTKNPDSSLRFNPLLHCYQEKKKERNQGKRQQQQIL